uniref:PTTG1 interacting protein n=1 Tax=Crocodylus porosus TaxID=8502 RepID=A0A7M4EAY4_CROPO
MSPVSGAPTARNVWSILSEASSLPAVSVSCVLPDGESAGEKGVDGWNGEKSAHFHYSWERTKGNPDKEPQITLSGSGCVHILWSLKVELLTGDRLQLTPFLMNFEALIIAMSVVGGAILLALVVCCCCCCKKKSKKPDKDDERAAREREKRRVRQEERRAEMKSRHDEIRKKYGLFKEENPYAKFENN